MKTMTKQEALQKMHQLQQYVEGLDNKPFDLEAFERDERHEQWYLGQHSLEHFKGSSLGTNGYLTKESAEQALAFRRILNYRDWIEGGYVGQEDMKRQWFIICEKDRYGFVFANHYNATCGSGIPFTTKENAQKCIDDLGIDLIRTAYGVRL